MKRLLAIFMLLALALAAAAGADEPASFRAGAGKATINPELGMPLAGYFDRHGAPSIGVHDDIFARAVVLESKGRRMAMVGCDMLIVTIELRHKLEDRVRDLHLDFLSVSANHTHSAIGAYVDNTMAEIAVMGDYDPRAEKIVLDGMEKALRHAAAALVPARIGSGEGPTPGVSKNRRHKDGATDPAIRVLGVWDQGGQTIAVIFNHGVHPTVMGGDNLKASGDLAGKAEALIEAKLPGSVAMFMNAGLGDQGPARAEGLSDWERVDKLGQALADRALEVLAGIEANPAPEIEYYVHDFDLPEVHLRPDFECWYGLTPLVKRLGQGLMRTRGELMGLSIDNALLLFSPAELGNDVRANITARFPGRTVFVASHSNDLYGYVITPEDYATGGYESCMNFYGPDFAPLLEQEFKNMVDLGPAPAPAADPALPGKCPCGKEGI